MLAIQIRFDLLLQNHPFHNQIKSLVSGQVKSYSPPCCIQVSYALNKSGAPIVKGDYNVPEMGRKSRFVPDSEGNLYLIEVCDMGAYLNGRYGYAENYKGATRDALVEKIINRTGIIRFGKAHIDVWDGEYFHQEKGSQLPEGILPVNIWNRPSVKSMGIFFWSVGKDLRAHEQKGG